jgi:putative hemolysin
MIRILLSVIVLLVLSAFFSASETAFFSLNAVRLEKLKKRNRAALAIERLKHDAGRLLSTILIGNMFVNIFIASFTTILFVRLFGSGGVAVSLVVSTLVVLLFGEIIPKVFAFYSAERFALAATPVMRFLVALFRPLSFSVTKISDFFLRKAFKQALTYSEEVMTEEELKNALELGREEGVIEEGEETMIQAVLEFSDTDAYTIMTPRIDVRVLDIEEETADIPRLLREFKHSYIPIYRERIDNIVGVLRTKDFFLQDKPVREILQEAYFVPETKKIDDLLRELVERNQKMAIVVDEHGGFAGIVTREDIQEEIFGEMFDEYEAGQEPIREIAPGHYAVRGGTSMADLNWELDLTLPEEDTVAGFILERLGRFPRQGESLDYDGISFVVRACTKRRILTVEIQVKKTQESGK